jgi:hypothetical protein
MDVVALIGRLIAIAISWNRAEPLQARDAVTAYARSARDRSPKLIVPATGA